MELEVVYKDSNNEENKIKFQDHEQLGIWIESNVGEVTLVDIVRYEE